MTASLERLKVASFSTLSMKLGTYSALPGTGSTGAVTESCGGLAKPSHVEPGRRTGSDELLPTRYPDTTVL